MKYLYHINEYNQEKLYQEIIDDEVVDRFNDIRCELNRTEINILKDKISSTLPWNKISTFGSGINAGWTEFNFGDYLIRIIKDNDDWFCVRVQYSLIKHMKSFLNRNYSLNIDWYKCDSMDGVIELLDDLKNKTLHL